MERAAAVGPGKLQSRVVPAAALSPGQVEELHALFARHYENTTREAFLADLREKQWLILLEDPDAAGIKGFSTVLLMAVTAGGEAVKAVFSGDTIVDRAYWGQQELVRAWCRFMGGLKRSLPDTRLYWFLICKGYRTYLYLPLYFHDYYPRHDRETPACERRLIDGLAEARYPGAYQAERGVIAFDVPHGNLRPELAAVPAHRLRDPEVQFFLARNPGYARGDELACVAEIAAENMKGPARRAYLAGDPVPLP